jgi:hypothetical protein
LKDLPQRDALENPNIMIIVHTCRPHKPDDQPDLDTYEVQDHPFSTLGSVAIGLY